MAKPPGKVSNPQADDAAAKANNAFWYTFHGIGRAYLIRRGSVAAGNADVASVHGYSTIEEAVSNPNTVDATSQGLITNWDIDASLPVGGGTLGVVETVNITWSKNGKTATSSTQQNPTTAGASNNSVLKSVDSVVKSVEGFLGGVTSANLWLRVAKVLVGGAILIVGIAHLTGADNAIAKTARKVPLIL